MIPTLYEPFRHWSEKGSVYILSDLHFNDADCKFMSPDWITPKEQIAIINGMVMKNDTFICLGEQICLTLSYFRLNKNKQDSSDVQFVFIKVYNLCKQNGGMNVELKGVDIKEARKKAGLTQESLADATEFSSRQISRFESEENLIKLNKYYKLFKMLFGNDEEEK